jgi:hypothetical protein
VALSNVWPTVAGHFKAVLENPHRIRDDHVVALFYVQSCDGVDWTSAVIDFLCWQ